MVKFQGIMAYTIIERHAYIIAVDRRTARTAWAQNHLSNAKFNELAQMRLSQKTRMTLAIQKCNLYPPTQTTHFSSREVQLRYVCSVKIIHQRTRFLADNNVEYIFIRSHP